MRKAIIIGVANYHDNSLNLKNPVNDAKLMQATLKKVGFSVSVYINPTKKEMLNALVEFQCAISEYNELLFYYAGHGFEYHGENFLTPADFNNKMIMETAINISDYIKKGDFDNIIQIFILDACRTTLKDNKRCVAECALGKINAPSGTLISYATGSDTSANDGFEDNGLFTGILCKYIPEPNTKIEDLLKKVRIEVREQSCNEQTPWEHSSLTGNFYFNDLSQGAINNDIASFQPFYTTDDEDESRQYRNCETVESEIKFKIANSKFDEFYIISKSKSVFWRQNVIQWWAPQRKGYCAKRSEAGIYYTQDLYEIIYPYNHCITLTRSIAIPKELADKIFLDDTIPLNDNLLDLLIIYKESIIGDLNFNLPSIMS